MCIQFAISNIFITDARGGRCICEDTQKEFISEEVMKIMDDAVNNLFGIREESQEKNIMAPYSKEKANANIDNLIDFVIRGLCKLNKPFKYSVTGLLMQNNGAGLNTCSIYSMSKAWRGTTPTTMAW